MLDRISMYRSMGAYCHFCLSFKFAVFEVRLLRLQSEILQADMLGCIRHQTCVDTEHQSRSAQYSAEIESVVAAFKPLSTLIFVQYVFQLKHVHSRMIKRSEKP